MSLSPAQRTMRARIAAHKLHATHDSRKLTENGRRKFMNRFLDEVDPDRTLPKAERERRAGHARSAYFAQLALRRSKSASTKQQ